MGARRAVGCAAAQSSSHCRRRRAVKGRGCVAASSTAWRRLPLAGAHVELVNADDRSRILFSTTSDSLGRFVLDSVARGRYIAGFIHPMLDSLGLAIAQRLLTVSGRRRVALRSRGSIARANRRRALRRRRRQEDEWCRHRLRPELAHLRRDRQHDRHRAVGRDHPREQGRRSRSALPYGHD